MASTARKTTASSKKTTTAKNTKKKSSGKNVSQERYDSEMRREVWLLLILAIAAILALSNFGVCGAFGKVVSDIMFGIFGWMAYIFPFYLFFGTAFLVSNDFRGKAVVKFAAASILYLLICFMLEMIFMDYEKENTLIEYYRRGSLLHKGGGFAGGILEIIMRPLLGTVGTYILSIVGMVISVVLITEKSVIKGVKKGSSHLYETAKEDAIKVREESRIRLEERRQRKEQRVDKKVKGVVLADLEGNLPTEPLSIEENLENIEKQTGESMVQPKRKKKEVHEITMDYKEPVDFGENLEIDPVILPDPILLPEPELPPEPILEKVMEEPEEAEKPENIFMPEFARVDMPEEIMDYTVDVKEFEEEFEKKVPEYQFPDINFLTKGKEASKGSQSSELQEETAQKLTQTLLSFGVRVTVSNVSCGPSVTRYELQPEQGVKVSKIVSLADDIKLNLAAADIRIEAPIPGKAAIGIEVPNKENSTVMLRDLLESPEFKNHPSKLAFAVGKDIAGQTMVADIAKMPHLLIAGATGSGKSVCINTLVMSILYKAKPDEVKLIMVDPKVVELSVYNGIPHLMIPVVTDPKKAAGALNWAVAEMTDRYNKFAELNVRDLKGYNEKVAAVKNMEGMEDQQEVLQVLPQIVIIVDELADLMMVAPGDVEDAICRLAQLARAAGIHLVIATQRPSVNVITGLIKANVPSRIAFSVSSGVDSRTIIDMNGAEKLLGKGDMLFYPVGYQKPVRVQGAFVSDKEVGKVAEFLVQQSQVQYNEEISNKIENTIQLDGAQQGNTSNKDDYFVEAGRFIIEKEKASIGMLQRMFKIGFNRAARIMDQLAEAGVVGPEEGTKPRKILMTMEEFNEYIK